LLYRHKTKIEAEKKIVTANKSKATNNTNTTSPSKKISTPRKTITHHSITTTTTTTTTNSKTNLESPTKDNYVLKPFTTPKKTLQSEYPRSPAMVTPSLSPR
jgi:hypothetical protein